MSTAVLMPSGITDEWREDARRWVAGWYAREFVSLPLFVGACSSGEWSKGEAIADALRQAGDVFDVFVLADADSFMHEARHLREAIDVVRSGRSAWVVPHSEVYRLRDVETRRLHDDPTAAPRLGWTCRSVYEGPAGGGITVVSRAALELVHGIDPRFLGWGGEDVAFGWALGTLAGPMTRLDGRLVHLWHPHPAPSLRGSPESEELVALYKSACGIRHRMASVVAHETPITLPPLAEPIRFRMIANRNSLRLPTGTIVRFVGGIYETSDPDEVEQIRAHHIVREERRR